MVRIAMAVWGSLSLKLVLAGVGFVVFGALIGSNVWAGLFPLWGFGLIILGSSLYTAIWYSRRPSSDNS
jgi:hypothetical protein